MKEGSEIAQAAVFEIIENQIRDNSPREVRQTLERLFAEGKTKEEAMKLIGCAVAIEIFEIMKHKKPFYESRYVRNLSKLPELPWKENEEKGI
jgi:peroxiredoxin family protein